MDMFSYLMGKKSGGGGVTPTGTISITENGTVDVTNYASAEVNVSGGGSLPTTIEELNTNYVTPFVNYVINTSNSYEPYTNEAVTLYTPDANYTQYMIYKRGSSYRAIWSKANTGFIYKENSGSIANCNLSNSNYSYDTSSWTKKFLFGGTGFNGYRTDDYSSIEACINALKNPNQYYYQTSDALSSVTLYNEHSVIITNTFVIEVFNGEQTIATPNILSKDETIQVIS